MTNRLIAPILGVASVLASLLPSLRAGSAAWPANTILPLVMPLTVAVLALAFCLVSWKKAKTLSLAAAVAAISLSGFHILHLAVSLANVVIPGLGFLSQAAAPPLAFSAATGLLGVALLQLHGSAFSFARIPAGFLFVPAFALGMGSACADLAEIGAVYAIADYKSFFMARWDGIAIASLALVAWTTHRHASKAYRATTASDQGKQILIAGSMLLLIVGISVAILSTTYFTVYAKDQLGEHLSDTALHRADMFDTVLEDAVAKMREALNTQVIAAAMGNIADGRNSAAAMSVLIKNSTSLLEQGFSGLRFYRPDGSLLYAAGHSVERPAMSVTLMATVPTSLLWNEGFVLRRKIELHDASGRHTGTFEAERQQPHLTRAYLQNQAPGSSFDALLCGYAENGRVGCFPTLITRESLLLAPLEQRKKLPIDYALEGHSGLRAAIDYRDKHVTAAYAPAGQRDLGVVTKLDTRDLYAPIRELIENMLLAMCGLTAAATLILRSRVVPLVEEIIVARDAARSATQLALEREIRIRAVVDNVNDGIATMNADGIILSVNSAGAKIFGRLSADLVGRHFSMLLPARFQNAGNDFFDACKSLPPDDAGRHHVTRMTGLHTAGNELLIELSTNRIELRGEAVFISIIHDVTQAHATQEALRKSEEDLRNITDNLPVLISYVNRDGQYEFINRTGAAWLGRPHADIVGRTMQEIFGPAYASLAPQVRKVLDGEVASFEAEHLSPSYPAHAKVSYLPRHNQFGQVEGFYLLAVNTTEEKALSAALEQKHELLQVILDTLDVGVAACDQHGSVTLCNFATRDIYGLPADEITPHDWASSSCLYHADGITPMNPEDVPLMRALRGERVRNTEMVIAPNNAPARRISASGRAMARKTGEPLGAVVVLHDVTALKSVEEELRRLARCDDLTGLANRNQFNEKLADAFLRSDRTGHSIGLMYLDIDRFKLINDVHGHRTGDLVLQAFAKRLRASIRKIDTAARLGGDEFVIIMEGLHHPEQAEAVAQKIIDGMAAGIDVGKDLLSVSTSIGIAVSKARGTTTDQLLGQADQALYAAKAAGRNTYSVYRPLSPAKAG